MFWRVVSLRVFFLLKKKSLLKTSENWIQQELSVMKSIIYQIYISENENGLTKITFSHTCV